MPCQAALLPPCSVPLIPPPTLPAPPSLCTCQALQIVTGYGEAGQALVTSPYVGKLIFVGSTQIGRKVGLWGAC